MKATAIDADAIDLAHEKPILADDVSVWPVLENGEFVYRLERRRTHRFYRIGVREYAFLSLLDGRNTVAAACGLAASRLGTRALTSEQAESVAVWSLSEGIVRIPGIQQSIGEPRSESESRFWKRLNPFWIQIPLVKRSERWNQIWEFLSPAGSASVTTIGCGVIAVGVATYFMNADALHRTAGSLFSATGWIYFLVIWVLLKIFHEIGHAVACHRQRADVGDIGVVLILGAPLAYVDVTSCWRLPSRIRRIIVSAAGMYVELLVASIAMLAWLFLDGPDSRFWLANIVVTAGLSTLLFNANPLMRFDGYYILSDAIEIPNLYGEASAEMKRIANSLFYGTSIQGSHYRAGRRMLLILYGVAAFVWRMLICLTLFVTASLMFSGAGIVFAAFGIVVWFGVPLGQLVRRAIEDFQFDRPTFFRFVASTSVAFVIGGFLLLYPFSSGVTVHGVVHDPPGDEIRSLSDGFVASVFVCDGDRVVAGQPLIALRNIALQAEMNHLTLDQKVIEIRLRQATDQHDASAESIARTELAALERQIAELRPKVESLEVVAPRDGIVTNRQLAYLEGQFVREGDELLRLSDGGSKEVIAAVHQDHIAAARQSLYRNISVSNVRCRHFQATLHAIDPRASRSLPDPALSALRGGPLEVQPVSDSSESPEEENVRLTKPHFVARAELPTRGQIGTGARVRVHLGQERRSILQRARIALANLWSQHQQAE